MKKNKYINFYHITGQVYITPFIKVTHDRTLNGELELIFGWFNKEMVLTLNYWI